MKGTGITSTSSPSVQTAAPVTTVSINSNTFPLTQQLAIASNLSNPSNTSTTIEDRNVGTKTLEISPQTNDSRDMNVSQSNYSSVSSSGPTVSHPLPFPAIAAASPKANCAATMVASEDNTAMNSTAVNQNSTDSSSNISHTSADITASTAKKKISRFIVKSVPKEVFIVIPITGIRFSCQLYTYGVSLRKKRVGCLTHPSGRNSLHLRAL